MKHGARDLFIRSLTPRTRRRATGIPTATLPSLQVDPPLTGDPLDKAHYFGCFFDLDLGRGGFYTSC